MFLAPPIKTLEKVFRIADERLISLRALKAFKLRRTDGAESNARVDPMLSNWVTRTKSSRPFEVERM